MPAASRPAPDGGKSGMSWGERPICFPQENPLSRARYYSHARLSFAEDRCPTGSQSARSDARSEVSRAGSRMSALSHVSSRRSLVSAGSSVVSGRPPSRRPLHGTLAPFSHLPHAVRSPLPSVCTLSMCAASRGGRHRRRRWDSPANAPPACVIYRVLCRAPGEWSSSRSAPCVGSSAASDLPPPRLKIRQKPRLQIENLSCPSPWHPRLRARTAQPSISPTHPSVSSSRAGVRCSHMAALPQGRLAEEQEARERMEVEVAQLKVLLEQLARKKQGEGSRA